MSKISIIFVNYNTVSLLVDAVWSVFDKTKDIDFEVIVVDNNSEDNSQRIISDEFGDSVRYIKLLKNIGFGRANNVGIEASDSGSDYLFLLNPDTLLVNNSVKILADYMNEHPKVGVTGGNLFDRNMRPIYSYHRPLPGIWTDEMTLWMLGLNNKFIYRQFHNRSNKPLKVGNVSGANMMIRRHVLDRVGMFDPDFFMYSEETELTYRIRKAGYGVVNVPESKIIHLEGQSFEFCADRQERMLEGRAKYYRKTRGECYLRLANALLRGGLRFRIVFHSLFWRSKRLYFAEYLKVVKKTYI